MKKLILAAACAAASGTIFANSSDTTEQRINLLETELQKLKAELAAQKQTQNNGSLGQITLRFTVLPVLMQRSTLNHRLIRVVERPAACTEHLLKVKNVQTMHALMP